jgi:hypothetical protein
MAVGFVPRMWRHAILSPAKPLHSSFTSAPGSAAGMRPLAFADKGDCEIRIKPRNKEQNVEDFIFAFFFYLFNKVFLGLRESVVPTFSKVLGCFYSDINSNLR